MKPNPPLTQTPRTSCICCGTCCEKGGPAFHTEDRPLIDGGVIHTRYLYTIRKGEPVADNVQGHIMPAASDIIKIKGKDQSWECVFFEPKDKTCGIYEQRPMECKALKCWDTREMEAVYHKNRLTRQDLLAGIEGLWELIDAHEKQCAHDSINRAIQDLEGTHKRHASEVIVRAIQYDKAVRRLVTEKGYVTADMVDFLFGRPLMVTLKAAGCMVEQIEGKFRISKKGSRINTG